MIDKHKMMALLSSAYPAFRAIYRPAPAIWDAEVDEQMGLALHTLADEMVLMLEAGDTQTPSNLLDVVDHCLLHGDAFVRESAMPRLLARIQHSPHYHVTSPEAFRGLVAGETAEIWDDLIAFRNRKELL